MNTEQKAATAKRLLNDEGYQLLFEAILDDATRVFRDVTSTQEAREQAHGKVCLIDDFRKKLRLWMNEQQIAEHNQKGQHRE